MRTALAALARRLLALLFVLHAATAAAQANAHWPVDFQGLWWNPAEPGWGVGVFEQGATLSSVLFVYGADGKPAWYVAPNLGACSVSVTASVTASCSGTIYQTTGPWFGADAFSTTNVTVREVGQFQAFFSGAGTPRQREMTLTYTIDGATVVKPRLQFQDVSGSALANFSRADSPYTGLWWNPDESGWGVGIFQYRSALFAVLFVYGVNGKPAWYVASLHETGGTAGGERSFEGPVFATRGSWWFTRAFSLSDVRQAGSARIVFPASGAEAAALTYAIDGATVQSVIRRLSAPGP